MAMTLYATNIYNNSGGLLLWQGCLENNLTITVSSSGVSISCGDKFTGQWSYNGTGTFLGLATSSGATTATYPVGTTFTTAQSTLNLYIVDQGGAAEKTFTIKYKGNTIHTQTLVGSVTKTLKTNNKAMYGDVEVSIS